MAPLVLVLTAATELARNRLRTILAVLGVLIGVAAVVAMDAIGRGTRTEIERYLTAIGSNVLVVMPDSLRTGGVRQAAGTALSLSEDDARAIAAEIDGVLAAAPIIRGTAQLVAAERNWSTIVYGTTNAYFAAREWQVEAGRDFEPDDLERSGRVVVLGRRVVDELFGADVPADAVIGRTLRIRTVPFVVVGVLASKGLHMGGSDADDAVFVPLATARTRLFGSTSRRVGRIHTILMKAASERDLGRVQTETRALLRQRLGVIGDAEDRFTIRDLTEVIVARREAGRTMERALSAFAVIGLVVGGIGIANVMLASVTERTREIGVRMAVGARTRDVMLQFLVEATLLAVLGGLAGAMLGAAVAETVGWRLGWQVDHDPWSIVAAFALAATVGILSGVYPAIRAAGLQPVDALRHG